MTCVVAPDGRLAGIITDGDLRRLMMREPDVIAIPKASRPEHIRENRATLDIEFTDEDRAKLDQSFPPPTRKTPLETL